MLSISGPRGRLCDGWTRREMLRIGGATMLGLSLPAFLRREAAAATNNMIKAHGPGAGSAKHVILIYLQGGPSHIDIFDPKPDAPENIRGQFKPLPTKLPDVFIGEHMPKLASILDKVTLIRSVSYTPNGLFNHTAAMYQMLTGYTADKVSPSGQLEPPAPNDYPNVGSNVIKLLPIDVPMLPFVMLPRPLQESNVIGKAGTAGFLGKAFDPYYLYPPGADTDKDAMDKIKIDDLSLRPEIDKIRLQRRSTLWKTINEGMPEVEKAVSNYALDKYYERSFDLLLSGRARDAFDLTKETDAVREKYGKHPFGQSVLLARRLIEAGTRFVQVNWPSVANGDPKTTAWDTHESNFGPLKNLHCPKLDSGLSSLISELDERGILKDTIVLAIGEFGRSPRMGVSTSGNSNSPDGRDHWPYCYSAVMAGGAIGRGVVYGKSDEHASSPAENPVHPTQLLATIYHMLGISPETIVLNHLNQPREIVQAKIVPGLFA